MRAIKTSNKENPRTAPIATPPTARLADHIAARYAALTRPARATVNPTPRAMACARPYICGARGSAASMTMSLLTSGRRRTRAATMGMGSSNCDDARSPCHSTGGRIARGMSWLGSDRARRGPVGLEADDDACAVPQLSNADAGSDIAPASCADVAWTRLSV